MKSPSLHHALRSFLRTGLAACLFFIAEEADADWSPAGVQVTALGGADVKIASDGAGGVFIGWTDGRTSQSGHGGLHFEQIYLQHLTSAGAIAPGWPADGLLVSSPTASNYSLSALVPDGFGGALVAWSGFDAGVGGTFLSRVLPSGQVHPDWPPYGYKACCTNPASAVQSRLAADGAGGAYMAWTVYVQHISPLGTLAPGWPTEGIPIVPGSGSDSHVMPAPGGGVYLAWDADDGGYVQRMTAGGAIENGWPAQGVRLLDGEIFNLNLQPDGQDGAMVSAIASTPSGCLVVTRRVSAGAQSEPPVSLVSTTAYCSRRMLVSAFDQAHGAVHAWLDERSGQQVYAGRTLLGPPAVIASGWATSGMLVSTTPGSQSYIKFPGIAADGEGGAFVALDSRVGSVNGVRVQHVQADGSVDPAWGPEGKSVLPTPVHRWEPAITAVGPRQAVVVWHEGNSGLYAQKFTSDGAPVSTVLSLVDSDVQPGRVSLRWQATDAALLQATVERTADGEDWTTRGTPRLEGTDLLVYDEESVPPGRLAYRLRYVEDSTERFSDLTWLDVPALTGLALGGFHPNPAIGAPAISFNLTDARPASLLVHDVRGRVVFAREVGGLGPGTHVVRMDASSRLASGIYWIQLSHRERTLTTKGLITH